MAVEQNKEQESLATFDWDNGDDFFGIPGTPVDKVEVPEVKSEKADALVEPDVDVKEEETKVKDKKETTEESFFNEDPITEDGNSEDVFTFSADDLKNSEVFSSLEFEEGETIESRDQFLSKLEDEVDARVGETFEAFFEEMDDDGKEFLKFKKNGGKTEDFFKSFAVSASRPADKDAEDYRTEVVKFYLSQIEGGDRDEVADKIEWMKESGKLDTYATKYDAKLDALDKKNREETYKVQKEAFDNAEKVRNEYIGKINKVITDNDSIQDFVITKKDKKELGKYITKASVKVGKNRYITSMQSDLQKAFQDPEKTAILAKLLKSDFNMDEIKRSLETKVIKKTKEKLQRGGTNKVSSRSSSNKRSLTDFF